MERIEIIENESIWVVRYPAAPTIETYLTYLDEFRAKIERGQRVALIIDFTHYNPVGASAELRDQVSMVMKEQMDFFDNHMVCEVRVCSNPMVRGILTVFDFVTNLPWPCNNVSTGYVAELWARSLLSREGLPAPKGEVWSPPPPRPMQQYA